MERQHFTSTAWNFRRRQRQRQPVRRQFTLGNRWLVFDITASYFANTDCGYDCRMVRAHLDKAGLDSLQSSELDWYSTVKMCLVILGAYCKALGRFLGTGLNIVLITGLQQGMFLLKRYPGSGH